MNTTQSHIHTPGPLPLPLPHPPARRRLPPGLSLTHPPADASPWADPSPTRPLTPFPCAADTHAGRRRVGGENRLGRAAGEPGARGDARGRGRVPRPPRAPKKAFQSPAGEPYWQRAVNEQAGSSAGEPYWQRAVKEQAGSSAGEPCGQHSVHRHDAVSVSRAREGCLLKSLKSLRSPPFGPLAHPSRRRRREKTFRSLFEVFFAGGSWVVPLHN